MAINDFSQIDKDYEFLSKAFELAQKAQVNDEVPIGSVLVLENQIIGEGYNQPIQQKDVTAHAEIMALRTACNRLQNYRLPNTVLYTTLEPCFMCTGALIHARVARVVFGAKDLKQLGMTHVAETKLFNSCNHHFKMDYLPHEDCERILKNYFLQKRYEMKKKKEV